MLSSNPTFPIPVVGSDLEVPLVDGVTVRYANLDYAASAPALREVRAAVDEVLEWYSSVHRGAGFASTVSTELLAASRESVRRFVGGRDDDAVLFTRNTTDALNLLAGAVPADTTVVIFDGEHHANLLPWRRHRVVHLPAAVSPLAAVEDLTTTLAALGDQRVLVAVTGASNVTGEVWPIAALAAVTHRTGGRIVVDAAQLAPHRHVDLAAAGVDYVALSGHKLYAPYGAGVLVGRPDWLDAAEPYLAGGGAVRSVTVGDVDWAVGNARHEAGTPNLVGAVALGVACRVLHEVGFAAIVEHETELLDAALAGLRAIDGVCLYDLWAGGSDRIGVVAFNLVGWPPSLLAAVLSAEYGIGVRDGAFCAHPLVARLLAGDHDHHGGAVRASFGLGTTQADVGRLVAAVSELAERGHRGRYRVVDGRYVPERDERARPALLDRLGPVDGVTAAGAASACAGS